MAAWHGLEAAVFFITIVKRHPGGDASSGLDAKVELILVQSLAARASRFEIQHRLDGQRLFAQQQPEYSAQARVNHPVETELIPTVHVDEARITFQRVIALHIYAAEVAWIRPVAPHIHIMLSVPRHLIFCEQTGNGDAAAIPKALYINLHCLRLLNHALRMKRIQLEFFPTSLIHKEAIVQAMGVQDVRAALKALEIDTEIVLFDSCTATSQQAADNVGCQLGQIVKSLGFLIDGSTPVLALASGDQTIDDRKLAALFAVGRKKARMMTAAQCLEVLGYAPGGVPPIAHRRPGVVTYLDETLLRFQTVYASGGASNAIFPIGLEALHRVTGGAFAELART